MWTLFIPMIVLTIVSCGLVCYNERSFFYIEDKYVALSRKFLIFGFSPIAITLIVYFVGINEKKTFKEYWNNMYVQVSHYDSWNERVNCRHPIYRTEYYNSFEIEFYTGSDGKRHSRLVMKRRSRQVHCGDEHPYDVDEHHERWTGFLDDGTERSISRNDYEHYSMIWENSKQIEMNRRFHTRDGEKQESKWNNKVDTVFPMTTIHTYENRVRASGAFDNKLVPEDLKSTFVHPIKDENMNVVFSYGVSVNTSEENDMLKKVNAMYGRKYEVHTMLFLINSSTYNKEVVKVINQIWGGPNKNEIAIFVGVNENKGIVWCDVLSWSSNKELHSVIIDKISSLSTYDGMKVVNCISDIIPEYWKRRHFSEFKKMAVEIPRYVYITAIVLFIISHGIMWFFSDPALHQHPNEGLTGCPRDYPDDYNK